MHGYCACLNLHLSLSSFWHTRNLWNSSFITTTRPRYSACAYLKIKLIINNIVTLTPLRSGRERERDGIRCLIKLWFNNNKSCDNKFISYKCICQKLLHSQFSIIYFLSLMFCLPCRFKLWLSWAWLWPRQFGKCIVTDKTYANFI